MLVASREYHPYAACLMFKACQDASTVRKNLEALTHPARKAEAEVATLRAALELIATPKRPDGTYNRCREACEHLAKAALRKLTQSHPSAHPVT